MLPSSPPTSLYHITLLRHGESQGNLEGIVQGQRDYPLSPRGILQAQALANRWQRDGTRFDLILSSPLARASQTAEVLASALEVPLEFDPIWMERDDGQYAGLPIGSWREENGFFHPYRRMGETGETQIELYVRAAQAVQNVLHRPPGHYLVISHGGILNLALYTMLGIAPTPPGYGPRFRFQNTAFASFTYTPAEHVWRMLTLNDRSHWPDDELAEPLQDQPARSAARIPPPGLNVRPVHPGEVEALRPLFDLADAYHRQALPGFFREPEDPDSTAKFVTLLLSDPNPDTVLFVAEAGEDLPVPIGLLLARVRETPDVPILVPRRYAIIENLVVDPGYRRQGVAQALIDHTHAWARQKGLDEVELSVWEFNTSARRLYEKLGYQVLLRRMGRSIPGSSGRDVSV